MPKRHARPDWVHWAVLGILLVTLCIAFPVPAHSTVCLPPRGCPQVEPPKLSQAVTTQIIEGYLAQNPPVVRFALRKPVGANPPPAYVHLLRAGLLRISAGNVGLEPGPSYELTEKGTREITAGVFRVRRVRIIADITDFIEIPVGHFRYLAGSAILTPKTQQDPDDVRSGFVQITFKYYFAGNANAVDLMNLGPARDWPITDYALLHTTLNGIGRVAKRTITLRPCHGMWLVREWPPYRSACP